MSPELVGAFERQWPEVAGRLQGLLASKNVPSCKRDDVVQETGLRLFGMWEKVDRNRPLWPLAVTIALNLMRDEARRDPQREVLGAVPEMPALYDVEHEGLARIELERVQQAMAQLSPSHRDVLMSEIAPHAEVSKPARNATKMMRLRARRALTTLLETAVLRAGLMGLKVRRSLGLNDPFLPMTVGAGDTGAASATALAIVALLFGTIQVQPSSVANASEKPSTADVWMTGTNLSPSYAAGATRDELLSVKKELRTRTVQRSTAADGRAKDGKRKDVKGKKDPLRPGKPATWGAPPPDESAPLEVPLPIGNAHLGLGAGYGVLGVQVGNRPGSSTPVCLSGVEPTGLGCGTAPAQKVRVQAGAQAEANGQKVDAGADEEVETDIG